MYKKMLPGVLLVFFTVPAFGAVPEFADIDKDKDGVISQSEALEVGIPERLFAKLDVNKDQKLTAEEYNLLTNGQS